MISYILKFTICLAVLLTFYHFVLQKEKMHNFNRFFLIGSLVFSFLIPQYTIYVSSGIHPESVIPYILDETIALNPSETGKATKYFDFLLFFKVIYTVIAGLFLFRFFKNLFNIIKRIRQHEVVDFHNAKLVLVNDKIAPHTFWNYIFINKDEYNNNSIEKELFTHELTHVTQNHTFDIILIEILHAILWFNPVFIYLKKAIRLNHEFIADASVIDTHDNTITYQELLLKRSSGRKEYYLASNLNFILTKKRLLMMTKQKSGKAILLKKMSVIPLLCGLLFILAERVEASEKKPFTFIDDSSALTSSDDDINKQEPKDSSEYTYKDFAYRNAIVTVKDKNGNTVTKKYSELTEEEKKQIKLFYGNSVPKKPSKALIEQLKNKEKYAIWIDGKVADNKELNSYKNTDFEDYSGSFVHKNARSKRFPQEYQYSLETPKFRKERKEKQQKAFKKWLAAKKGKSQPIEKTRKDSIPKRSNPKIVNRRKGTFTYTNKDGKTITKKTSELTPEERKMLPPPPPRMKKTKKEIYDANGEKLFYVKNKKGIQYYNRFGQEVTKSGKLITPEESSSKYGAVVRKGDETNIPPPPKRRYPKVKKGEKSNIPPPPKRTYPKVKKGEKSNIPPPPKPKEGNFTAKRKVIAKRNSTGNKFNKLFSSKNSPLSNKNVISNYYLDNKSISKEKFEKIDYSKIATVNIIRDKDGNKNLYAVSNKK